MAAVCVLRGAAFGFAADVGSAKRRRSGPAGLCTAARADGVRRPACRSRSRRRRRSPTIKSSPLPNLPRRWRGPGMRRGTSEKPLPGGREGGDGGSGGSAAQAARRQGSAAASVFRLPMVPVTGGPLVSLCAAVSRAAAVGGKLTLWALLPVLHCEPANRQAGKPAANTQWQWCKQTRQRAAGWCQQMRSIGWQALHGGWRAADGV